MRFLILPLVVFGCFIPLDPGTVPQQPEGVELEEGEPQEEAPPERKNLARLVKGCKKCHADVHAEWEATQHARSWSDPVFQAEIADLPDKGESCARCHAPRSLYNTGFGKVPLGRDRDRELGVNCVTCHMEGNIYYGPYESSGHGGVDADPEYRKSGLCLSCHGQPEARAEHDQGTSFLAGPAAQAGKTCQDCHMRSVERKLVTKKSIKDKYLVGVQLCRMHHFTGVRRGELVKDCAELALVFEAEQVVVQVTTKTGHGLPATSHRDVILELTQWGSGGEELKKEARTYRFPKGPVLAAGGPTAVAFAAAPGLLKAKATLTQVLTVAPGRKDAVSQPISEVEKQR